MIVVYAYVNHGKTRLKIFQKLLLFSSGFLHLAVLKDEEAILKHPENVTAEVGQNAFMTCKSHGNLQDHTSWVKILENENDIQILKEGSEVLEIKNVTLQSEGLYACVVGNHESTIVSEAYLSVQNPITIIPINDPRNLKVSFLKNIFSI